MIEELPFTASIMYFIIYFCTEYACPDVIMNHSWSAYFLGLCQRQKRMDGLQI